MPAAPTDSPALRRARVRRIAGLYAITPDLADTAALAAGVSAALAGGASAIQYRNKTASAELRRAQALALARIHARQGGVYIVNDDPALAAEIGADGVHIGEDDGAIESARAIVGSERIVGVSCYDDFARAEAAVANGADYVAFGSFFPSPVKPGARRAGLELLERARELGVLVVAIGGIDAGNAPSLARAGADAVAVISAVFDAPDVREAAHGLAAAFAAFRPSPEKVSR